MKKKMKKWLTSLLGLAMVLPMAGCGGEPTESTENYQPVSGLSLSQEAVLKIAIPTETDLALDLVATRFMQKYPNVNVQLEYVEAYEANVVPLLRDNAVDLILQTNILYAEDEDGDTTTDSYFYNFLTDSEIDFSHTTDKLMNNYKHIRLDENGNEISYLYSVPMGGEVRGMFVNKTLLASVGKTVPTTWDEFLDCCETLQTAGYVPIGGNPSTAAASLGLADCVTSVVHDEEKLAKMKNAEQGVSALFADSLEKMYTLATKRYYDYKRVETELNQFCNATANGQAHSFLGLTLNDQFQYERPENGYGYVAFFPYLSSIGTTISRLVSEYKMTTEWEFIVTPTSSDGNNPVYLTPYYGLCANKNSENLLWAREFVNFFFQEDINKLYASKAGIIPNTPDAISYMAQLYHSDSLTSCAACGDILFSDSYNGYTPLNAVLLNTIKCSAMKYMVKLNRDESGEIVYYTDENGEFLYLSKEDGTENTKSKIYRADIGEEDPAKPGYAFCSLSYYLNQLEAKFAVYRGSVQ